LGIKNQGPRIGARAAREEGLEILFDMERAEAAREDGLGILVDIEREQSWTDFC
jgi:hypothetical protein